MMIAAEIQFSLKEKITKKLSNDSSASSIYPALAHQSKLGVGWLIHSDVHNFIRCFAKICNGLQQGVVFNPQATVLMQTSSSCFSFLSNNL